MITDKRGKFILLPYKYTYSAALLTFASLWLISLYSCSPQGQNMADASTAKMKKLQVKVGEVKEVKFTSPKDTTWQVVSSSENKEIADVSNKELEAETTASGGGNKKRTQTFLVKGITPGSVKVSFAEKRTGEEGPGRLRKAYQVEVITK